MISNVNPYQGMQNALHPIGSNIPDGDNRVGQVRDRGKTPPTSEMQSIGAPAMDIADRIYLLQIKWDLLEIHYPPFFPIATYQRMDLIGEIRNLQEEIERSSLSPELKRAIAGEKLRDDATDAQIAKILDKMFSLRETSDRDKSGLSTEAQPGAILKLEV